MCQDSPKTREDRLKMNQEKHRLSQDRLQDKPGCGQDGAKMPPNCAKTPQRRPKIAFRQLIWMFLAFVETGKIVKSHWYSEVFFISFGISLRPDSPKMRADRLKMGQEEHRLRQNRLQDGPGLG